MHSCDVVIIGAGIAGASAAYEIAACAKVILFERERQPGYHATGRSAATFAPGYGNRVIRALTAASHAFYREHAGGLAEHPVLTPRGALFIGREDQRATLERMAAETEPELPAAGPRPVPSRACRRWIPPTSRSAFSIRLRWTSMSPRSTRATCAASAPAAAP